MAYLIQNTRTDDFIDEHGEWTMIRSFAKKFPSKLDAERWIAKNGIDDYPPIYKIVTESTHHRSFKKFVESRKVVKEETSYEGDVINVAFDNAKITGQEFDDIYDSGFNIGKVYTWTQLEPTLIHARIPSFKIQRVKDELKKLEQMGKYDDFIYEGCKKKSVKEDVEQKIVIHTKNGKVDSIEQGTYMPNGVFIRNGGHNFDKGFIGMDPQEAKASLIKYSRIPEKMIIVESNSWTMGDGTKVEIKGNKVFITKPDGKKYWMPRYEWEHLDDDDGDIENGPSFRVPNWIPVK